MFASSEETKKEALKHQGFRHGRSGARTRDLPRVRRTLSRLSYTPIRYGCIGEYPAAVTFVIILHFFSFVKS